MTLAAPLLLTGLSAGSAASAGTATESAAFPLHRGAGVPACVKAWHEAGLWNRSIFVKNTCGRAYKIKVNWAGVPDSGCWHLSRGEQQKSSRNKLQSRAATVVRC